MPKSFPVPKIVLPLSNERETSNFFRSLENYVEFVQPGTDVSDSKEQDLENLHERDQRHHFLTKVFTLAAYREGKESWDKKGLQTFQRNNKYLFMVYHPAISKKMGRVTANHQMLEKQLEEYEVLLHRLLECPPRRTAHINACQHMFGYFKKELKKKEKADFQEKLELFKGGEVILTAALEDIYNWAERFHKDYLLKQTYFEPYPKELFK